MKKKELVNRLLSIDKQISTRSWITAGGDLGELIDELREEINRETFLPSNLDEAAEEYGNEEFPDGPFDNEYPREIAKDAFKAGAEWVARQRIKAHCIESYNPISEGPDDWPHVVTLLYNENENTPHVVAGDEVEIIIRKI